MALDLPPPATPLQSTLEAAQAGDSVGTVKYRQYTLHITGLKVLDEGILEAVTGSAPTLSDAVRNISSAYYAAGYPAARVLYSLVGNDLYVHADAGKITAVKAPEALQPFFEGMENEEPLRDTDLEPRRTLAALYAERAGLDGNAQWVPDESGNVTLDIGDRKGKSPQTLTAELGNPGNRFVGRHFLDLGMRDGSRYGDELRGSIRAGVKGMNDTQKSDHYFEGSLGWSRVTSYGLFGAGYRAVHYDLITPNTLTTTPSEFEFDGQILVGELFWFYPLHASFNSRLTTFLKLDHTEKTTELNLNQQDVQIERYPSAEAGLIYARTFLLMDLRHDVETSLVVRQGLGDSQLQISPAEGDYLLVRPAAKLKQHYKNGITASVEINGQISDNTVPEQSQWVMGGLYSTTAYLPGVAVGDSGYLGRIQGEYAAQVAGYEITPRAFIEYATAKYNSIAPGKPAVADVGVGVDVKLNSSFTAGLAYAHPFHDKDIPDATLDESEAKVFFKLAVKF